MQFQLARLASWKVEKGIVSNVALGGQEAGRLLRDVAEVRLHAVAAIAPDRSNLRLVCIHFKSLASQSACNNRAC